MSAQEDPRRLEFSLTIEGDGELPGFGAYLAGSAKDGTPLIKMNFHAMLAACVEHPMDWREFFADTFVHEFLHVVQEMFDQEFRESDVDEAILKARQFYGKTRKQLMSQRRYWSRVIEEITAKTEEIPDLHNVPEEEWQPLRDRLAYAWDMVRLLEEKLELGLGAMVEENHDG